MSEIPLGGITQQGTGLVEGNIDGVQIIRVTDYQVALLDQAIIKPPEENAAALLGGPWRDIPLSPRQEDGRSSSG
jgi:hypothetical protein